MSRAQRVRALARERDAVIIAHYYQRSEVKEVADFIGDSLAMANYAATTQAGTLVVAGVRFMAETAALLNPAKTVLLPEPEAGCSLASNCEADRFAAFLQQYPHHTVVTYINSSVEVKAMSHVLCTSANAEQVVSSLPENTPIVFAPDRHLGRWLEQRTGRHMVLWDAVCEVHADFSLAEIDRLKGAYPSARVLAHPECEAPLLELADVVGSTSRLLAEVVDHPDETYIVATEEGILKEMRQQAPFAKLIPAPQNTPNACACGECPYMKLTTLESLEQALIHERETIRIPTELQQQALRPLRRMLDLSR